MAKALPVVLRVVAAAGLVWLIYALHGSRFFRLYPLAVVLVVLGVFAQSLLPGRTPVAERVALRMGESPTPSLRRYCRAATRAWAIFLSLHALVTLASVFCSPRVWALYNGAIAYVLLGAMFLGEYLVRRKVRHAETAATAPAALR